MGIKGIPARASNGPRSTQYADLLTLKHEQDLSFLAGNYHYWRSPGPWADKAARDAFLAQPVGEARDDIIITFPVSLYWHIGPCPVDTLLTQVALEAIAKQPGKFALESVKTIFNMLILHPTELAFPAQYLDTPDKSNFVGEGALGFFRAESALYNGQRVWRPGIVAYSALFPAELDKAADADCRHRRILEEGLAASDGGVATVAQLAGYRVGGYRRAALFRYGGAARLDGDRLVLGGVLRKIKRPWLRHA